MSELHLTPENLQTVTEISQLAAKMNVKVTSKMPDTAPPDAIIRLYCTGTEVYIQPENLDFAMDALTTIMSYNTQLFEHGHLIFLDKISTTEPDRENPEPYTYGPADFADAFELGVLATKMNIPEYMAVHPPEYSWTKSTFIRLTRQSNDTGAILDIAPKHLHIACQIFKIIYTENRGLFGKPY